MTGVKSSFVPPRRTRPAPSPPVLSGPILTLRGRRQSNERGAMEDEGSSSIENGQHHQEFRRGEEDYKKDEKDDDERENLEIEEVLDFQDGEEVDKEMMEEEDRPESIGEDFALPPLTQRTGTFRPRNRSVTDSMAQEIIYDATPPPRRNPNYAPRSSVTPPRPADRQQFYKDPPPGENRPVDNSPHPHSSSQRQPQAGPSRCSVQRSQEPPHNSHNPEDEMQHDDDPLHSQLSRVRPSNENFDPNSQDQQRPSISPNGHSKVGATGRVRRLTSPLTPTPGDQPSTASPTPSPRNDRRQKKAGVKQGRPIRPMSEKKQARLEKKRKAKEARESKNI